MSIDVIEAELASLEKLHAEAATCLGKQALQSRIRHFCFLLSIAKAVQSYPSAKVA